MPSSTERSGAYTDAQCLLSSMAQQLTLYWSSHVQSLCFSGGLAPSLWVQSLAALHRLPLEPFLEILRFRVHLMSFVCVSLCLAPNTSTATLLFTSSCTMPSSIGFVLESSKEHSPLCGRIADIVRTLSLYRVLPLLRALLNVSYWYLHI